MNAALFLDRDGVMIEDVDLLTTSNQVRILPGVPGALALLSSAGYKLIVVSNQTVVARGLASEHDVQQINRHIEITLRQSGSPPVDAWFFCPHHPKATLAQYRTDCECRKPKPGMLFQAKAKYDLDLSRSFMIGDRITDVIAGSRAGCRTILVQTGKHLEPPIENSEPLDPSIVPDFSCANLAAAAAWILQQK
jgi:D-glycero-D-manno-heptose 1,7-bisphosphate phosphatase